MTPALTEPPFRVVAASVACAVLSLAACTAFNPEVVARVSRIRDKVGAETLVVDPRVNEQRPGVELGFVVYMSPSKAEEMGAPTGKPFVELLRSRVGAEERAIGHPICQHGYRLGSREPFVGRHGDWEGIWTVGFECNAEGGAQS